jgi:Ca2+-binding EF-hand superfamily protein
MTSIASTPPPPTFAAPRAAPAPVAEQPPLPDRTAARMDEARRALDALEAMEPAKASAASLRASPADRRSEAADFCIDLMDGDEDGKLGQDEFVNVAKRIFGRNMAEKLFAGMDKDRDGRLSKGEIEADLERGEGVFAEVFRKLFDGNGDGRVTQGEFRVMTAGRVDDTRATRFFNGMDRTGDGTLSPREMRWGFGPMREDGGAASPFLLDRLKLDRRT